MEIMIPNPDFDFNSTPYATAPSTPKRFGECYFSAPPSPSHLLNFYQEFDNFYIEEDDTKSCSDIPIAKPKSPKFKREKSKTIFDEDFAFNVGGEFEKEILPAEELFDGGKIRSFKPITKAESKKAESQERGRERSTSSLQSRNPSRRTRSVSPYRVSKYPWEEELEQEQEEEAQKSKKQSPLAKKADLETASSSLSSKSGSRKWRLKDFFLFRSASEGRASDKDPIKKYTALFKKNDEKKISSNRISEGGSLSKRRVPISAHEVHYTKNRALSEDMKKKTTLPFKHGILGRWFV